MVTSYQFVKSDALDASNETPGLNVRNDSDIAKIQKDIENIKLAAANSSKIVDVNVEPKVTEHSTWNEDFYTFDINRLGESSGESEQKSEQKSTLYSVQEVNNRFNEVLQHNYKDVPHIQSIAAIPQIIEKSIYIESQPNNDTDTNPDVTEYQCYVCGLNIGGEEYTVLAKVAVNKNGNRYYDHNLTAVAKGKLIDIANNEQSAVISGFGTTPDTESTTNSQRKYRELISTLQTNLSKIVDANGEPKVVYHQTNATEYVNVETGELGL